MNRNLERLERLEELVADLQTELNRVDRLRADALGVGAAEDLQVLRLLLRSGPQRVGEIARLRATSMTTASGRLDRLERRGLVRRDRVPDDRRAMVVALTKPGVKAAKASNTERSAALKPVADDIPLEALKALVTALHEQATS